MTAWWFINIWCRQNEWQTLCCETPEKLVSAAPAFLVASRLWCTTLRLATVTSLLGAVAGGVGGDAQLFSLAWTVLCIRNASDVLRFISKCSSRTSFAVMSHSNARGNHTHASVSVVYEAAPEKLVPKKAKCRKNITAVWLNQRGACLVRLWSIANRILMSLQVTVVYHIDCVTSFVI